MNILIISKVCHFKMNHLIIGSDDYRKYTSIETAPIIAYKFARPNDVLTRKTRGPGAQLVNEHDTKRWQVLYSQVRLRQDTRFSSNLSQTQPSVVKRCSKVSVQRIVKRELVEKLVKRVLFRL